MKLIAGVFDAAEKATITEKSPASPCTPATSPGCAPPRSGRARYGALCGRWRCEVADELAHRLTLGVRATAGVLRAPSPRQVADLPPTASRHLNQRLSAAWASRVRASSAVGRRPAALLPHRELRQPRARATRRRPRFDHRHLATRPHRPRGRRVAAPLVATAHGIPYVDVSYGSLIGSSLLRAAGEAAAPHWRARDCNRIPRPACSATCTSTRARRRCSRRRSQQLLRCSDFGLPPRNTRMSTHQTVSIGSTRPPSST